MFCCGCLVCCLPPRHVNTVYEEFDDHLFVHHDIMLASYPLCLEWLDFDPEQEKAGNMLAVGTMSPQIEVWDLDIVDAVEPAFVLGDAKRKSKKVYFFTCTPMPSAPVWHSPAHGVRARVFGAVCCVR